MDALAGHVPVDERLRQALGDDRRRLEAGAAQADGEGARTGLRDADPARDAAELVARALDDEPARRQPRGHAAPGVGDLRLVVLPQHVERADHRGQPSVGRRHLEAAEAERDGQVRREVAVARADAGELLLAVRTRAGSISRPRTSTSGRAPASRAASSNVVDAARTVAEVDDEGVGGVQQGRLLRDPAVDASQPVRVGRAARDRSDGHAPSLAAAASVTRSRDHGERMPRR